MPEWMKSGNTAVVTGGANGIGLAAVSKFLETGMNVAIADNNRKAVDAALSTLAAGERLLGEVCDVSDFEQVCKFKDAVYAKYDAVHCLMNNAGAALGRPEPWDGLETWKQQLDINLWGIVHGCQAFVPAMREASIPAAIINTGSKQGITNPPGGYAYNLSKAGVLAYTQSLAHALRQQQDCPVSVHLLVPGFTYSNMIARFIPQKPDGAWSTGEVIDFMLDALKRGDFYILCPDNDTPRELDERRIEWNADDIIKNRPALSRWHPEFAESYEAFVRDERQRISPS